MKAPFFQGPVEDDVLLVLHAPISGPDRRARAAHFRCPREPPETYFQTIQIVIGLFRAPGIDGVVGDLDQVETGEAREAVLRHRCPKPGHVCGCVRALRRLRLLWRFRSLRLLSPPHE